MGPDLTLVRVISCCSLCASGEGAKERHLEFKRMKGRREERYVFLCVFLRAASGSCGLGAGGGQASPSCLSAEDLSAQPVCTSHREA